LAASLAASAEPVRKKGAKPPKARPAEELLNPLVGPRLATWLVGPVSWMATDEEIEIFLGLTDETQAASFIEAFWKRRDPDPRFEANPNRELFDERMAEAEKLYREGTVAGHRTDRGTIYVLYGEPTGVSYELSNRPGDPPIEEWRYPKKAEPGLDDREPKQLYRFFKPGELTVFYRNIPENSRDRALRELRRPPR
jgi:GWxTD domain-containing protein